LIVTGKPAVGGISLNMAIYFYFRLLLVNFMLKLFFRQVFLLLCLKKELP